MNTKVEAEIMQCFFAVKDLVNSSVGDALVSSKTLGATNISDEDVRYVLQVLSQSLDTAIDRTTGTVHSLLNKK